MTPTTPTDQTSAVAAFFDEAAARYDAAYDGTDADAHVLHIRMQAALGLLGAGPGAVLDVGMGPGRLVEQLAGRGWTVSGVDPSAGMVERARQRTPAAADRLVLGRADALAFDDASFDAVAATGVLEYAPDLPLVLAEIARVLRPGGRAVVSVPNPRALYAVWKGRVIYPAARAAGRIGLRSRPRRVPGPPPIVPARLEAQLAAVRLDVQAIQYTSFLVAPTPLDTVFPRATVRAARRLEGSGPRLGRVLGAQIVLLAERAAVRR